MANTFKTKRKSAVKPRTKTKRKARSSSYSIWPWFARLSLLGFLLLAGYGIYLDAHIKQRFAGNTWQVPAQLYARPLWLLENQEIHPSEIEEELSLLSYRKVSLAQQSGEYSFNNGQMRIFRRDFAFADGQEPVTPFELTFRQGRIKTIRLLQVNTLVQAIRLEPWLISRLVNDNDQDRMLLRLDEVPEVLIEALILNEDQHFYAHHGIAPLAILRALLANIRAGKTVQGGSTLTQQLVKNLFLSREKSLVRKAKEALMALIIDARYSKSHILQAYLNEVYLGQNGQVGVHGFALASRFYFNRPLAELSIADMALLVAIVKGPSYYNPLRYPERAKSRRDRVLRILFENHRISAQQYAAFTAEPLRLANQSQLRRHKHPAFMDKVARELRFILDDPDSRQSGLRVFTTLDSNAQRKLEASVTSTLEKLEITGKQALQTAAIITDTDSGEIRALVGDSNSQFQGFNRALDAKRAIGSLVKPAIYLAALQQPDSYHLATPIDDKPISLKDKQNQQWRPQNFDKQFRGSVPIVQAISESLNVPAVNLGMEIGLNNISYQLYDLGVEDRVPLYPSLTLGAIGLSPITVAQMYQTIANQGRFIQLHAVQAVSNKQHQLVWQANYAPRQVVDERAIYLINFALHKVAREGTARQIKQRFPIINMAGKTGTTNDFRDSWFSGYDNNVGVTIWIGRDDNTPTGLTGSSGALQLFLDYQSSQQPKSLVQRFPDDIAISHFDRTTGMPVKAGCGNSASLPAIQSVLPMRADTCLSNETKTQNSNKSWWQRLFN
jgi:penicillin-binding protein 1B